MTLSFLIFQMRCADSEINILWNLLVVHWVRLLLALIGWIPQDMMVPLVILILVPVFCFHNCCARSHTSFCPGASHLVRIWSILSLVLHAMHSILSSQPLICFQWRPTTYPLCISIHKKKWADRLISLFLIEVHSCSAVISVWHRSPAAARASTMLPLVPLLSSLSWYASVCILILLMILYAVACIMAASFAPLVLNSGGIVRSIMSGVVFALAIPARRSAPSFPGLPE